MYANPPKFEFQRNHTQVQKAKYVLHKTWNKAFSRRNRAKTATKKTKKRDARRAKLLFRLFNLLFFQEVLVAIASLNL